MSGTHGTGPSTTSVEEAGSGAGSGTAISEHQRQEYQRQLESFVRREDIPETVKAGVKAYFENIHAIEEGN